MNPELITAVKERLALGHTEDMVRTELAQAGYDTSVVEQVIAEVRLGTPPRAAETETLPSATTLFHAGWQFIKRYPSLVVLLAIPLVVLEIVYYVFEAHGAVTDTDSLIVAVGGVMAMVAYFLLVATTLRIAALDNGAAVHPLAPVWGWVKSHVFGLLWVLALSTITIMGGFLLFIIPGIIVSILLYLAQYAYAVEGKRGIDALLRSRELVQGHWWQMMLRLLVLVIFFFIAMLGMGLVVGLIAILAGGAAFSDPTWEFIFNLLGQVLGAIATIMGIKIGMVLYRQLAAKRPAGAGAVGEGKGKYMVLAWFGAIFILLLLAGALTATKLPMPVEEEYYEETTNIATKQRALELRAEDDYSEDIDEI